MATHSFSITSSLSCEEAFARLIDLERVPEWDHGVRDSKRLDESRFDVTVTGFDGEPTSVIYAITDVDEPTRFVMVGENDEFRAEDELVLAPRSEHGISGCELTYTGSLVLRGDNPPLTPTQLDSVFPKLASVAEAGLRVFLNPADADAPD
jgi:hypothetical protein